MDSSQVRPKVVSKARQAVRGSQECGVVVSMRAVMFSDKSVAFFSKASVAVIECMGIDSSFDIGIGKVTLLGTSLEAS